MDIMAFGNTHQGMVSGNNEDSYGIFPDLSLFVAADGLGGHAAGEVASRLAVEVLKDSIITNYNIFREKKNSIINAIQLANTKILQESAKDAKLAGMGTTIVVVQIEHDRAIVAHVGDSRVYLVREDTIIQLTKDHTIAEEYIRAGMLTKEEALYNPYRHALSRALGTSADAGVEISDLKLHSGDTLLLCTDGLTNMMTDKEILIAVRESAPHPEKITEQLINRANRNGGIDNITVITICVVDAEKGPSAASGFRI